jgi:hypothetical protein
MIGTRDHRMQTTEALLRRCLDAAGAGARLELDPVFQGLPGAAHGGSVLALLDSLAGLRGPRRVRGVYRRRVPVGVPLFVETTRSDGATAYRVLEGAAVLADGSVCPSTLPGVGPEADDSPPGPREWPAGVAAGGTALPVSNTCFVCGLDNPAGLGAQLRFDGEGVFAVWTAPARFRAGRGGLAPIALTALLDEAAFWLGALASGESGMTTDLVVTMVDDIPLDAPIAVSGERRRVRPTAGDPRYWQTRTRARDARGRVVAEADITFVAVRGAARRLTAWLNPLNPPGLMARIFPSYA